MEWADGSDDCTDINPWDAQIPSSSTHPSATAVGDLNESVTDVRIAGAKSKGR